jgi:hypothetical protein
MHEIFLNYRTKQGKDAAVLLDRELSERFGTGTVFLAKKSLEPGTPYDRALLDAVRRSSVVLVLIGEDWLNAPDQRQPWLRALDNENDWVRLEIAEGLAHGVRMIPLLLGRKPEQLDPHRLPEPLARLADCQYMRIFTDDRASLTRLGDKLRDLVPGLTDAGRTEPAPPERPGAVHNEVGSSDGTTLQVRDFTQSGGTTNISRDVRTIVNGVEGQVHTGDGDQHIHHGPTISGDGTNYIAGSNHGGISQKFGNPGQREDDDR